MIVGHNPHRLEKRIEAALLNGITDPREASFLQNMARRIFLGGRDASLSDRQAAWLFKILARHETKVAPCTKPRRLQADLEAKKPEAIDIMNCLIDPPSAPHAAPKQSSVTTRLLPPQAVPIAQPRRAREPDMASILQRALAKNENLRKRQARLQREYQKP